MNLKYIEVDKKYFDSFHAALDSVARERIHIEMIEAPALDYVRENFYKLHMENNWPVYFVLDEDKVVAWADITPLKNPRLAHRSVLGISVLKEYRKQGIASKLVEKCLAGARKMGLEKVELSVYTSNQAAINLYKKFHFQEIGVTKNYRKLDGRYFDVLNMELFL